MQEQEQPSSDGRRTRSQVAPKWTGAEALILVNEIAAVEGDCLKALSSHQKWKIIVENCTALGVSRTLNQCRGKWNALLGEYNKIKQWEAKKEAEKTVSYWGMESGERKEIGLPDNANEEVYKAVDEYVRARMDEVDTDPDSDPDAEADLLHLIAKLGTKRKKRRSMPLAICAKEKHENCYIEETPQEIHAGDGLQQSLVVENSQPCFEIERPQTFPVERPGNAEEEPQESRVEERLLTVQKEPLESRVEEMPQKHRKRGRPQKIRPVEKQQKGCVEEEPQESRVEEMPQKYCKRETPQKNLAEGKRQKSSVEASQKSSQPRRRISKTDTKEQLMAEKLRANAELIIAVVNGSLPEMSEFSASDLKNVEDFQTFFVRRQADKLIACLGDIVNTLNQFPSLLEGCE